MSSVCIIGCSHTAGVEAPDEFIIKDYWDFQKKGERFIGNHLEFEKHRSLVYTHYDKNRLAGHKKYVKDCKKFAWPAYLKRYSENVDLRNHALEGSGIDFFHFLFNYTDRFKNNAFITERANFKNDVLESDLLVWQLTNEPRYFLTWKNIGKPLLSVSVPYIKNAFDHNGIDGIASWKQKIILDYFETLFDEERFLNEKIQFIHYIVLQRILRKKKTLIFSIFEQEQIQNIKQVATDRNLVKFVGLKKDEGLLDFLIQRGTLTRKQAICKFGHPSHLAQQSMAAYLKKYIDENFGKGLLT